MDASLSALLSASLSKEAAAAERMAALEGGLASLAAAAAAAQAALADATNKGDPAVTRASKASIECGTTLSLSSIGVLMSSGCPQPVDLIVSVGAMTGRQAVRSVVVCFAELPL